MTKSTCTAPQCKKDTSVVSMPSTYVSSVTCQSANKILAKKPHFP